MTENEIRNRLRDAFGEADYPPALTTSVRSRLDQPPASGHSRLMAFAAALLAIVIVTSLVYIRSQSSPTYAPSSTPQPRATPPSPGPPMSPLQQVPIADLAQAGLTSAVGVMIDPNLASTKNGRTIRLIGAYADAARIVLILRTLPQAQPGLVQIYDDRGLINAGGSGGGDGSLGDDVFVLDQGPHAGTDGIAHLHVTVPFLQQMPPSQGNLIQGPWTFAFALKLQPATAIALRPGLATVGSWKVSVEAFELTPSVIHLKLRVTGASPDAAGSAVKLIGESGSTVQPAESSTTTLGADLQLDDAWIRSNTAASYQLRIDGGGGHYVASFFVPAPAAPTPDPNLNLPKLPGPYDLPTASESLALQGAMDEMINFGHPWQCLVLNDPSGAAFILELYVRSRQGVWYLLGVVTDLADKPFSGAGTYGARAYVSPVASNGPADHTFAGAAQLTVTSGTAPFSGTVKGTLNWDDDSSQQVSVSGGWTCKASAAS